MDFVGSGRRLAQGDVGDAARELGVETAVLLAFIEVEAAGRGFDRFNRPKMLRETHRFWAELGPGPKRDRAVKAGLANKNWIRNYPPDSYPDLQKMRAIDHNAALRSCSWGLSQILGSNCLQAGFPTAELMVKAAMQGEREQLLQMVTLMKSWGMGSMLRVLDFSKPSSWEAAARKWNGPGYATHNYHGRMAAAYRKHSKGTTMTIPATPSVLQAGMKGEAVRNLQTDLASLGYEFVHGIDGRFGPETDDIVRQFQTTSGLSADGKVGPATKLALNLALEAQEADLSPPPPEWPGKPETPVSGPPVGKAPAPMGKWTMAIGVALAALVAAAVWLFSEGGF